MKNSGLSRICATIEHFQCLVNNLTNSSTFQDFHGPFFDYSHSSSTSSCFFYQLLVLDVRYLLVPHRNLITVWARDVFAKGRIKI